jgi:ERF superfamily
MPDLSPREGSGVEKVAAEVDTVTDTQTDGGAGMPPAPEGKPDKASSLPAPPSPLAAALVALQRDLPDIRKTETAKVETKTGSYSYSYANLATISRQIRPLLHDHGFAFTAWTQFSGDRFVLAYQLLHTSGQSIAGEYPLPTGGSPQALGSAITYGRRYALCAVTGLTPEDDDDDATHAARAEARISDELRNAQDAVRGAWAAIFGPYRPAEVRRYYATKFRHGAELDPTDAAELRRFAAHLSALPAKDAGSDPETYQNGASSEGEESAAAGGDSPRPITSLQRKRIFAELNGRGIRDAAEQRTWLGEHIGRPITSRGDLTLADAKEVIDWFEQNPPPPEEKTDEEGQ